MLDRFKPGTLHRPTNRSLGPLVDESRRSDLWPKRPLSTQSGRSSNRRKQAQLLAYEDKLHTF